MNEHIEKVRAAVDAHREKHTQGLLFVFGNGHCVGGSQGDGTAGVAMCGMARRSPDECEANARRIVATWNATLGFPTAALEEKGFIGSINAACEARKDLIDVLTDALEFVEDQEDADCVDGRFVGNRAMGLAQQLREALAKHTPKVKS